MKTVTISIWAEVRIGDIEVEIPEGDSLTREALDKAYDQARSALKFHKHNYAQSLLNNLDIDEGEIYQQMETA